LLFLNFLSAQALFLLMNKSTLLLLLATLAASALFSACSTAGVQDARAEGLNNRQDRMDSRTQARQQRWQERGEREDARAKARFDSW
jgi:outer membrane murein-binding lipoprotein Lpp